MPTTSSMSHPETLGGREAVLEELDAAQKLIVVTHENPDGDALGSLAAMHELLTALGKDSLVFMAESELPLPYEYRFLPLQRVVTEAPEDLEERTLVFLDCGNLDRNPAVAFNRSADLHILNIDHHHDNTRFGTANYVDPTASCTAEIVWDLIHGFGVDLTLPVAEALYVGLITDTGCFMYENTSARAHMMAAELIDAGVDVHGIYQRVYEGVPLEKLQLLAQGLANVERYDEGRLTITQLRAEDFARAGAEESYSEGVIDHLRAVRGTQMAALVRDRLNGAAAEPGGSGEEGRLRKVSLRASDSRLDVSLIARAAGGGGHRAAAGFSTSLPWSELVVFLREQLAAQLPAG
jgi:phosphoesterase RecJ-like protein